MRPTLKRFHQTTQNERAAFIRQFHGSGLSRQVFARKHGFAISTLHRWLAGAERVAQDIGPLQFSEVKLLPSSSSAAWAAEIVSPSGIAIRFRDLPKIEDLARILSGAAC